MTPQHRAALEDAAAQRAEDDRNRTGDGSPFDTEAALEAMAQHYQRIQAECWDASQKTYDRAMAADEATKEEEFARAAGLERQASLAKGMASDLWELLAKHRGLL